MKIIAHANETVIVEMTRSELAQLQGCGYEHCMRPQNQSYGSHKDGYEIGTAYPVGDLWHRLSKQATIPKQLEDVSKTLTALSDLVTQTKVRLEQVSEEAVT